MKHSRISGQPQPRPRAAYWAVGCGLPFLLLLSAGCGSSASGAIISNGVTPTATVRQPRAGDSFTWTVYDEFGGACTASTLSVRESADTYNGESCIRTTSTSSMEEADRANPNRTVSWIKPFNGAVSLLGCNNGSGDVNVVSDTAPFPLRLGHTMAFSGCVTLADGTTTCEAYRVTGTAHVDTPAGAFDCWTIDVQSRSGDNPPTCETLYYSPVIGNFVRAESWTPVGNGTVDKQTLVLAETNVPH